MLNEGRDGLIAKTSLSVYYKGRIGILRARIVAHFYTLHNHLLNTFDCKRRLY